MKFEISHDSLNSILKASRNSKPKSSIPDEKIQKELLIHIRDIEKKIKFLTSSKEKATLFYEIGLIWRDQIGDMRSAIVNFQKSYEADSTYLPNLKAVREIFISKKNWDFVLDIIDTELSYIKDNKEKLYLIILKSEILNNHKKDFELAKKNLLSYLKKNESEQFFIIRKLKSLYFKNHEYHDYGNIIETLIDTSKSEELQEALLIDMLTLTFQNRYKPKKDVHYYIDKLSSLNESLVILNHDINWETMADRLKVSLENSEVFNSNNLYILYRIYKDIIKNKSEANKILIGNYQNIKDNFLLLCELENHYADNYNWEKLIDIQKKKFNLLKTDEERSNLFYKIGHIFLTKLNNIKNSKKYYLQSLELLNNNISTIRALSKIAYLEHDIEQLVYYHLKEIELSDNNNLNAVLYFKIAEIYLKNEDYNLAEKYYLKSRSTDESYYPATRSILKLYRANKQWSSVIDVLKLVIKNSVDPDKILSLKAEIGKLYFKRLQDFDKAIIVFKDILENNGYSMEVMNYLEELYKRSDLWDDLIKLYEFKLENIIDQYEKINILTNISDIFVNNLKNKNKSIPYLKMILDISPSYIPALQKLSFIYKEAQDWNKVIELNLNEMEFISSNQKKSILLKDVATIYKNNLNDLKKAMEYYELALEYNINNFEAVSELEYIYNSLKLTDKLVDLLKEKIDNSDSNNLKSDYSCKIAEYYIDNRPNDAIEKYWEALRYNPDNKIAFEELKRLYLKSKEINRLINLIMDYGERKSSENNFYIAQLYYLYLNNFNNSEKYLKKALLLDNKKEYYDFLIRLYFDNNKFENVLVIKDEYIKLLKKEELYAFAQYIISFSEYNKEINYFPIKEYIILFNETPSSHFFYKLFNLLYKNALWEDLINLIEIRLNFIENKREELDLNYHLALVYEYYQKNYENALKYYQKVIDIDKNHFLALQGKNRLYDLTGNVSGIIEMLKNENYDKLLPEVRNEILYKNSMTLIDKFKKYDDAEKLLQRILVDSPSDDRAFNKLYELYITNHKYEKILKLIDNKIPSINDLSYKESLLIKKSEIILLVNPNDTQKSISVLNNIIQINPNNIKAKMNLINFYFREKSYKEVIKLGELLAGKNIGVDNYQKILYFLFKAYLENKYTDRLVSISDMLLERKLLSFEEMDQLLPLYKRNKSKQQVLDLLLSLVNYDSDKKIDYMLEFLNLSKDSIDQERWHEKILHWLQITKSIELLNYYSKFFIDNSDYSSAISILEENIDSYKDENIKSSIYKRLGDLNSTLEDTDMSIEYYKKAVDINNNLSAMNKLRKIFSSDDKYIEEVLNYYPKVIKKDINNIFLINDLFYIYKKLDKELSVYNIASIIHSVKLENKSASEIYRSLKLKYPDNYHLYENKNFIFLKSSKNGDILRELFYTAIAGMGKLTRKTVSDYKNIEKITQKSNYKMWNTFNDVKAILNVTDVNLYVNKLENKRIDFIYPDNMAVVIPVSMLSMDQQQLSYFLAVQLDRVKSMNFLLNYHSVDSLIRFMKLIVNYTYDDKIFNDDKLTDYYKLLTKGMSRATRKKLYSLKSSLFQINWNTFDFKKFISSSYKTSLKIGLVVTEDVNVLLRAVLKLENFNNLTMDSDELIDKLSDFPELEEIFKFLFDDNYIALLNSLGVKLANKTIAKR